MKRNRITKHSQPTRQPEKAARASIVPIRTVLFGGAALLILFAWLQLILSLQIASTGRQIQNATEELQKLKRDNMAVVRDTAVAESEEKMTARAAALGYGPQTPVYLSLGRAFAAAGSAADGSAIQDDAGPAAGDRQDRTLSQFLLDNTLYDTTTAQREVQGSEIGSAKREP